MMRTKLLIGMLVTAFSGAVSAADLPMITRATPVTIAFDWSGFYVGGNIGYAGAAGGGPRDVGYTYGADYGTFANEWFDSQANSSSDSLTGGVQLGYNRQIGRLVIGAEADFSFMNVSKRYSAGYASDLYPYPDTRPDYNYHLREEMTAKNSAEWLGTIRARLGYTPTERVLAYVTGGVAYGRVNASGGYNWREYGFWWGGPGDHEFDRTGGFTGSDNKVRWGWTIGAGLEYAVTNAISIRGEYLYANLGRSTHSIAEAPDGDEFVTWKSKTTLNIARLGVNYKF